MFGIKWLKGTSEAMKNRCKMGADQTNRTVQAMCKADLFAPSISTKLICISINILESGEDEALNQLCRMYNRQITETSRMKR